MVAGLSGEHAVVLFLLMERVFIMLTELRQERVQVLPQTLEELIVQDHHVRNVDAVRLILIRASHNTVIKCLQC